jgi:hypothetical protein
MEERLSILRQHMFRRRSLTPSRVDKLWDNTNGDANNGAHNRVVGGWLPRFAGGTLAHLVTELSSDHKKSNRLNVVQLASLNKGTDMLLWEVYEHKITIEDFWIEPNLDLLVLLGTHSESGQGTCVVRILNKLCFFLEMMSLCVDT